VPPFGLAVPDRSSPRCRPAAVQHALRPEHRNRDRRHEWLRDASRRGALDEFERAQEAEMAALERIHPRSKPNGAATRRTRGVSGFPLRAIDLHRLARTRRKWSEAVGKTASALGISLMGAAGFEPAASRV
jgi:hypothetical protein